MLKLLGHIILWFGRWKMDGDRPTDPRFVLVAAPHTSNWDLPYMLAFAHVYQLRVVWMGKRQIFAFPFAWFMRAFGGIPVIRERRMNMVDAMAETLGQIELTDDRPLALVVPAEGTRSRSEYWKSGFYHIARKADVPIVLCFLDYKKRVGGFGPSIMPSGDLKRDMDVIRAFYAGRTGKFPVLMGPIKLKEEGEEDVTRVDAALD